MKKMFSAWVDVELIEKLRDITYWKRDQAMGSIAEDILRKGLEEYKEVPERPVSKLRPGRRIQ